ncbi:hypothetical protein [Candidatus Jordarchaeum sp.]
MSLAPIFLHSGVKNRRETAVSNRPPQQVKNWERGLNKGKAFSRDKFF